jgi:hypothetical protein
VNGFAGGSRWMYVGSLVEMGGFVLKKDQAQIASHA